MKTITQYINESKTETIYIKSDLIYVEKGKKEKKYRFSLLGGEHKIETPYAKLIDYWKWFDSVDSAKDYLNSFLNENVNEANSGEQEELFLAKKYVDEMVKRHKDYKTIRKNILSNLVNSEYGRTSNSFVTKVWDELNKRFPS